MNDRIGAPLAKERGDAKTFPEYDPELGAAPEFTVGLRWAGATNVCDPAGSAIAWPWESNRDEPFKTTQVDWSKSTINFRVGGRLPTALRRAPPPRREAPCWHCIQHVMAPYSSRLPAGREISLRRDSGRGGTRRALRATKR